MMALFPSGFMPHGCCYLWRPEVMALHATSDAIIALAYLSIPFALARFVAKRRDLAFRGIFAMFGVFILSCGVTHIFSVVNIWYPAYWTDGVTKAFTAAVSIWTAAAMWPLIPRALAPPPRRCL